MARRRSSDSTATLDEQYKEIAEQYRTRLLKPAPPVSHRWPPVVLGPTWQRTSDGLWVLPERTLGWRALGWAGRWLQHGDRQSWRYTDEQARWLLHWFALDEDGQFLYRDGVFQRLKGHGKDPLGATLCALEALGPCRFDGWSDEPWWPHATDVPDAWVQTAAVSLEQTKNTMRLFPGIFTDEAKSVFGLQIGKEMVHAMGDRRLIQAVTSSPSTLEGARASFVLMNETHRWQSHNNGHDMAYVISNNATKSEGGTARTLAITNAYEPSQDSVAQRTREAYEAAEAGQSLTSGILYDSLEAPPDAPLTPEAAPEVVKAIRGDSVWLDSDRIVKSILDTRNAPSQSRRFWYNQVTAAEDSWVDPQAFDLLADSTKILEPGDEVTIFFDGSKSDDATALVGCRVSDGFVFTIGMWQRPPGERGADWTAPRAVISEEVERTFQRYNVVAFYADPSHTRDDETLESYWDATIDEWHRKYRDKLKIWASPGQSGHSIMWDMAKPSISEKFTAAAMRCARDIEDANLPHDGDPRLKNHVHNARRYPNKWGVSLWKGHRESSRKVDLAVAMVGARMVRRDYLNSGKVIKPRSGVVRAA